MNILVSACLMGINCKYSGKNNRNEKVLRMLCKHTLIPVCPEQLGGLPTPRQPAEISDNGVVTKSGMDVTENYMRGAEETLQIAKQYGCECAILKANSPSCGLKHVYDGTFSGILINGSGITARLLRDNGIEIYDENDELL